MRLTVVTRTAWIAGLCVDGLQFDYETVQLTSQDVGNFTDIAPASKPQVKTTTGSGSRPVCRAFPDTDEWPSDKDWKRFNASLDGALLKPVPAGIVCYPGPDHDAAKCTTLVNNQALSPELPDDPIEVMTPWPADNPCPVVEHPTGNCTQAGLPVYVVNATSVKQIQIAVNFARNRNLRLVIK